MVLQEIKRLHSKGRNHQSEVIAYKTEKVIANYAFEYSEYTYNFNN